MRLASTRRTAWFSSNPLVLAEPPGARRTPSFSSSPCTRAQGLDGNTGARQRKGSGWAAKDRGSAMRRRGSEMRGRGSAARRLWLQVRSGGSPRRRTPSFSPNPLVLVEPLYSSAGVRRKQGGSAARGLRLGSERAPAGQIEVCCWASRGLRLGSERLRLGNETEGLGNEREGVGGETAVAAGEVGSFPSTLSPLILAEPPRSRRSPVLERRGSTETRGFGSERAGEREGLGSESGGARGRGCGWVRGASGMTQAPT